MKRQNSEKPRSTAQGMIASPLFSTNRDTERYLFHFRKDSSRSNTEVLKWTGALGEACSHNRPRVTTLQQQSG